jgi:large subunit ribosomal protein L30
MVFAVVRVRGTVNVKPDIKQTLELLQLTRVNHCVLVDESKVYKGMLQKVKDYTTWGEIDKDMLKSLIGSRGRLQGDKPLSEEYVKSATSFDSMEKLSKAIVEKQFHYKEIPEVKPLFRLNPPMKGYSSIKRSFGKNGALGYRGKAINQLIQSMI